MQPDNATHRRLHLRGGVLAISALVIVSTNYVTAKYAMSAGGFDSSTFSLIWTAAAAFYAFLLVMLRNPRAIVPPSGSRWFLIGIGLVTGAGMLLNWGALQRLDPTYTSLLGRLVPVLTIILGIVVFHERVRAWQWPAIVVIFLGGVLAVWGEVGERQSLLGTLLMLGACASMAVQRLLAKLAATRIGSTVIVFYRVALAVPVIGVWLLLAGTPDFHVPLRFWLVTLLGAFLGPCLSHVLLFRSLRYWPLAYAGIVYSAQPVVVLPLAGIFLGMVPSGLALLGGVLVLLGAVLLGYVSSRTAPSEAADSPRTSR